jgi:hypothetical protein
MKTYPGWPLGCATAAAGHGGGKGPKKVCPKAIDAFVWENHNVLCMFVCYVSGILWNMKSFEWKINENHHVQQ